MKNGSWSLLRIQFCFCLFQYLFVVVNAEENSKEPCQISKMEPFAKIGNSLQSLTILATSSILDVCQGSVFFSILQIYKDSQFIDTKIKNSKIQVQNKTQTLRKSYTFLSKVCIRRGHTNINNNNNNNNNINNNNNNDNNNNINNNNDDNDNNNNDNNNNNNKKKKKKKKEKMYIKKFARWEGERDRERETERDRDRQRQRQRESKYMLKINIAIQ